MKYSDLINIQNIVNESMLDENYLASDFKWGFELEAFMNFTRPTSSDISVDKKLINDLEEGIKEASKSIDDKNNVDILTAITESKELIEILENHDFDSYEDFKGYFMDEDKESILRYISDVYHNYKYYTEDRWEYFKEFWNQKFPNGEWQKDQSIHPNIAFAKTFEWASPILEFNIQTLKNVFQELSKLQEDFAIEVNDSCGFHIHLSYPGISKKDVIWLLCKLSLDTKELINIRNMNNINFFGEEYANLVWITPLRNTILNKEWHKVLENIPTSKKDSLIIHKQGALEWRGPRNFLGTQFNFDNSDSIYNNCKKFIVILWNFVKWIRKTLDEKEINGISRDEFFNMILKESNKSISDVLFIGREENDKYNAKRLAIKYLKTLDDKIILNLPLSIEQEFIYYMWNILDTYESNPIFKNGYSAKDVKKHLKDLEKKTDNPSLKRIISIIRL